MRLVVDASVVVAALTDRDAMGVWARSTMRDRDLVAPHLLPVEVASAVRAAEQQGRLSSDVARLAHDDLDHLAVSLLPYAPVARRVWELRANVTSYDAWYVALAEAFAAPLATLDARLAAAPGPTCEVLLPEATGG